MLKIKEFGRTFCFAFTLGLLALTSTQRCVSTAYRQNIALHNNFLTILFYD